MRSMISRHSALQSRPPARRASADMAGLFQLSGTQPVVGSEAPKGLVSQRPWTTFSALDADPATPARRRLASNAERQAECLLIIDLVGNDFRSGSIEKINFNLCLPGVHFAPEGLRHECSMIPRILASSSVS